MPESVKDRCTKAHEYIFLLTKKPTYYFDYEAIRENATYAGQTRGVSKNIGLKAITDFGGKEIYDTRNKRDVWTVATKPYAGSHFAVFPTELVEPMVLAGSRVGDIVFDPFFGSGTTGAVAQKLGRQYIGCELNPDYESLQNERLQQDSLILGL